ncbi:MAG: hypothetical protein IKA22_13955 [Lentisphaeria bacterium]|nr:hypothetical protein [Lentisphaeria bacterium]
MDFLHYDLQKLTLPELESLIEHHNKVYWEQGTREIDDTDYDLLMRRLKEIAPEHILLEKVGSPVVSAIGKVEYVRPLLSLDKAYSLEEVIEWANKHARSDGELLLVEPKYDGISANFENGILSTRGDGFTGENISDKIGLIELEKKGYCGAVKGFARGEILMRNDRFERFRNNIQAKGGTRYKNSRNVLTGLMTLKEAKDIQQVEFVMRRCDAFLSLVDYELYSEEVLLKDLPSEWEGLLAEFEKLPYPMDGIVIKIADKKYRDELGNTAHHPRGEIAYKFQNAKKTSKLINVQWSFGKNCLTPVAEIEPVELNGITIRHATLHNIQNIIDRDIQIGDTVTVERAGDVIPYIASSEPGTERRSALIEKCPCCGSLLERQGPEICCMNRDCLETNLQRLLAAVRNIGIEELGEPTLRLLMNKFNIRSLTGIFELKKEDFLKLPGFQMLSASNLYQEIQNARKVGDYQLLASLNVPHIGPNIAKLILKEYTLEELEVLDEEKLSGIKGIGPERAKALIAALAENKALLNELKNILQVHSTKGDMELPTVCFTGKMPEKRSYYEEAAELNGMLAVDDVNKNLSLLVAASMSENGTKMAKARKLGVKIIEIDEWLKNLKHFPSKMENDDDDGQLSLF